MSLGKAKPCPFPACEGGTGSLEIERDPLNTSKWLGWVRCDWCYNSGPIASDEAEAVRNWNACIGEGLRAGMTAKRARDIGLDVPEQVEDSAVAMLIPAHIVIEFEGGTRGPTQHLPEKLGWVSHE